MSEYSLSIENMMRVFPAALAEDKRWLALGRAAAEQLVRLKAEGLKAVSIYPAIEELGGDLLDILAHDYKIDWWDADYSVEEKRRTLANSWALRRILGSPEAVERAVSAIYPRARASSWEEYGGEPYHFRILIDASYEQADPDKHARVLSRVRYYKPARAHFDGVEYGVDIGSGAACAGIAVAGMAIRMGV